MWLGVHMDWAKGPQVEDNDSEDLKKKFKL